MNKYLITFPLIFLISYSLTAQLKAEGNSNTIHIPNQSNEEIILFADRSIYCSGESILFTADYQLKNGLPDNWSQVLYVELIRWNGHKLLETKWPLQKQQASGSIQIPSELLSGNYYLRAYTKWMRNFSVYDYAYIPLKIVNPYNEITDSVPEQLNGNQPIISSQSSTTNNLIVCNTNKSSYGIREKVNVNVEVDTDIKKDLKYLNVSVVKKGISNIQQIDFREDLEKPSNGSVSSPYLPDIRGVSLSGKIVDRQSKAPLENVIVNLSTPNNGIYYSGFKTNAHGQFYFTFPPNLHGTHDFYLNAQTHDTIDAEILIDNDFCNKSVTLPHQPFDLSSREKKLVQEMMLTQQINNRFATYDTTAISSNNRLFYGEAQHVIYTDTYIELPNMEEFFFELVPEVEVLYNKKQPTLRIKKPTSLTGLYPPLLLVDNIPVEESQFLSIPNGRIERVDVINDGYVTGNLKFNGLISLYSKKQDMAGINLSPNSIFFNYQLLSKNDYSYRAEHDPRIPDRRNTLYWNPHLNAQPKKTSFSFYTSDIAGEYVIYVQAIKNDSTPVYGKCTFTVK